jgi:murein DD-endopeptidase MepM/ murein hydrolase activator NlpD
MTRDAHRSSLPGKRKDITMAMDTSGAAVVDPSGNIGPTEHPPVHGDDDSRRLVVSNFWGGVPAFVSSEHGADVTPWNPSCSWYQYGIEYGLNGCQHPGMDIAIPFGTELFAAEGGEVVYAEPDIYYVPNHINILTPSGEVHIYGHMSSVDPGVVPGGRVRTGQRLGTSGNSNGDHLHFERRVPGACNAGFCALDPEQLLVESQAPKIVAFKAGDQIRVVDPPLRFRTGPGLDADIIEELPLDARLTVIGGPRQADAYDWYQVTRDDSGTEGWLAGSFCALVTP